MEIDHLRSKCIHKVESASPSTLKIILKILESAPEQDGALKVTTIVSGAQHRTTKTIFLEGNSNDIYGLAQKVWLELITGRGKLTTRLETVEKQPWYTSSGARAAFEKLCLNGCGDATQNRSRYCSPDCLKALSKWLDAQTQHSEKKMHRHLFNKVNRFKRMIEKTNEKRHLLSEDFT